MFPFFKASSLYGTFFYMCLRLLHSTVCDASLLHILQEYGFITFYVFYVYLSWSLVPLENVNKRPDNLIINGAIHNID